MSKNYDESYPGKMSDEQIKKQVVQQSIAEKKYDFPTETVELPSKGLCYPKNNPLSSGKIEMKYMTAKEEDILTSANLIRKGVVLDKLFQSLIVSPVDYNDLIIGDKNAIMIASRVLGYGSEYRFETLCPSCGAKNQVSINLSDLGENKFDEAALSLMGTNGELEFELPASKRKITFILATHRIEDAVMREMNARKKMHKEGVTPEITTRFKHMILSVDGNDEKKYVHNFVENEFLSRDSFAFREHIGKIQPDVDFNINFECSECGHNATLALPIDAGFFWPKTDS